jgi:hypothetical protein
LRPSFRNGFAIHSSPMQCSDSRDRGSNVARERCAARLLISETAV